MKIRHYKKSDREYLKKICVETASPAFQANEKTREAVCVLFNDYYTDHEPESIFVAVGDDNIPFGYILCGKDAQRMIRLMHVEYLPKLVGFKDEEIAWYEGYLQSNLRYIDKYPAHLHIDILEGHQRQGIGHQLVDALVTHLKEKKIKGLFLIVSRDNEKGVCFYRKYGFKEIDSTDGSLVMALDLSVE